MNDKQNSFENNLERLQKIVDQLESGELALEQGVSLYKEGLALTASCRKQLDEARLSVSQVTPEGLVPFDANASEEK